MRESPALRLIDRLLEAGARVRAYDPVALDNARRSYGDRIVYCADAYDAATGADTLVLMTEWNEFRVLDLDRIRQLLHAPVLFDCRNMYQPETVRAMGFRYHSFGRTRP